MKHELPLASDQSRLAEENLALVRRTILAKFRWNESIVGMGFDDLYQESCIALCKAAASYDPEKDGFEAYAAKVIRNHLLDYCAASLTERKRYQAISLEALREENRKLETADESRQSTPEEELLSRICVGGLLEDRRRRYHGSAKRGIEALELKVLDGCGVTDIARLCDAKPNLVGAWITKAKRLMLSDLTSAELEALGIGKAS